MAFRRLHQEFKHLSFPATKLFNRTRRSRRFCALAAPERFGIGLYGMELLEHRVLLTTVTGGDTFEYRQTNGDSDILVRVKLDGNISAELIGATIDRRTNEITLGNLSGQLNGVDVGNGLTGGAGLDVIGGTAFAGIGGNPNVNAIAAAGAGAFYALANNGGAIKVVLLTLPAVDVNGFVTDGPTSGTIIGTIPTGGPGGPVSVGGADVGPDGDLWFSATTGGGGGPGLFSVTPSLFVGGNGVDEVADSLVFHGFLGPFNTGANGAPPAAGAVQTVGSIAWVDNDLFGILNETGGGGGGGGQRSSFIFQIDPNDASVNNLNEIDIGQGNGPITGLDVDPQGNLIAIQSNGADPDDDPDQTVMQVFPSGNGFVLGPLTAPGTITGEGSSAMAFVSGVIDPFTGSAAGAFIGFDNSTNQFFFVNATDRTPPQFLWNVYVTQSDLSGKISIGSLGDLDDPGAFMAPFNGEVDGIRTIVDPDPIDAPDNTGEVLIGALSQDISDDIDTEDAIPYPTQPVPADIAFETLPSDVDVLAPGLVVEDGQDLGKFLLGGTFMGAVDARANLDFFYAGWLITGDPQGQGFGAPTIEDNFKVAGDLRSVISRGEMGGHDDFANYSSGFDLQVGGTLGTVRSYADFTGHVEVNHFNNAPRIQNAITPSLEIQKESEWHDTFASQGFDAWNFGPSDDFINAGNTMLGGPNNFMFNDTYDTAEYLGSISSSEYGRSEMIRLEGLLQKTLVEEDNADYYAVSLMAGQTVTVRVRSNILLTSGFGDVSSAGEQTQASGFITLGVFDPNGRLITTDINDVDPEATAEQFISFKTDRPGIYRFAIASVGDQPEYGANDGVTGVGTFTTTGYTLTAVGVGDIAFGGLVADLAINDLPDATSGIGIEVFRGDLGAIRSIGSDFISSGLPGVAADVGNIRAIDTAGLLYIDLIAPEGSVGHLRSAADFTTPVVGMSINNSLTPGSVKAIGGDYQLVEMPLMRAVLTLKANRAIGVIHAESMSGGWLEVNADDTGRDGVVDLIETTAEFLSVPITTHTGGNVRYIRCGGTVSRDPFFGDGSPEATLIGPGETGMVIDDSGAKITFKAPGNPIPNPFFIAGLPNAGVPEFIGSQIGLLTYPIRGAGGSVVINVSSDSGLTINAEGGPAEIGRVQIAGIGRAVLNGTINTDPSLTSLDGVQVVANNTVPDSDSPTGVRQSLVLDPRELTAALPPDGAARMSPDDFFLRITGDSTVDVLNVVAVNNGGHPDLDIDGNVEVIPLNGAVGGTLGNPVSIVNDTGGDLVSVSAATVGELASKGNLGIARSTTGTIVEGMQPLSVGGIPVGDGALDPTSPTPFLGVREGIAITGNVITLRSGKAIGNVVVSGGTIDEIIANSDNVDDPSQFEGINGTIYVQVGGADIFTLPGRVNRVRIGEGIAPSGSGSFQAAGIVVEGQIGAVTGENADIRGDLIALNRFRVQEFTTITTIVNGVSTTTRSINNPPHQSIERVTLTNGSIINADIRQTATAIGGSEFFGEPFVEFGDSPTKPDFEIGRILIRGNGGIIGSSVIAPDINSIVVADGGFGIFNTHVDAAGDGTINHIEASGYGLRNVFVGGSRAGELIANGDGTSLSTNAINSRVRLSETATVDPKIGAIDPFTGSVANKLTDIHEFLGTSATQPEISGVTDTGAIEELEARGNREIKTVKAWQIRKQSVIAYANSVGALQVGDIINGLELETGTLKNFTLKQDAFALTVTVSGRVKKIDIQGSLAANSVIRTQGDAGQIDSVNVRGNLIGNIDSSRSIKSINIGGDFTGNITVSQPGGMAIKTIKVGGSFLGSSINIDGNVGTIQSAGSLGSLGDTLTVNGNVTKLVVGGDLRSNVRVTGNLKTLQVKGSIVDGGIEDGLVVDVSNTINSLNVAFDIQQGVQVNALAIKKQKIGGQNLGEFNIVQ